MPKCIKCDWLASRDDAFGDCPHCGINRGWTFTKKDGRAAFYCSGCETGDTVFPCPKCGHQIIGSNDLFFEPQKPKEERLDSSTKQLTLMFLGLLIVLIMIIFYGCGW